MWRNLVDAPALGAGGLGRGGSSPSIRIAGYRGGAFRGGLHLLLPMVEVHHPNRETTAAKATKGAVILLLLVSAALVALVTLGGWSQLQGAKLVTFAYIVVYLVMAYFIGRWNRGVLPVAAALAVLLAVIAAVAGPAWFERDKSGFEEPALDPAILGLMTLLLVPVQLLLVVVAMRGFAQKWNVELEVRRSPSQSPPVRGSGPEPAGAA